ncbi:TMEM165/GDT1 family protein, partial [Sutterella wadsworthensis]|uniref:TMEM165/GDT1 family protein n=1 Tax=Sutterella wadsworthensis TaxID=40545 RepID=UPI0026762DA6
MFEIFQTTLLSTGVVAAAEIGDKTMLLAVFLAARFRKPWTIILGIFVATFLNHVIAGALGATLANFPKLPGMHLVPEHPRGQGQ